MNRHVFIISILTGIGVFLSHSNIFGITLSIFEIVLIVGMSAVIFVSAIFYDRMMTKYDSVKPKTEGVK